MNILKTTGHSARFVQKRGISALKSQLTPAKPVRASRFYSTQQQHVQKESSNVPWAIGSLLVFGPLLFKLTSPPPAPKKKEIVEEKKETPVEVAAPVEEEEEEETVEEPVKVVQKPYVLVGAGTASFAAAQAIKEKDPQANVNI